MLELKTSTGLSLVSFQPYGFSPIMAWVAVGCTICQLQISFKLSLHTHTATYWDPLIVGQSNLKEFTLISFWEEAKRRGTKNVLLFCRKVLRSGMYGVSDTGTERSFVKDNLPAHQSPTTDLYCPSPTYMISLSTDHHVLFSAHEGPRLLVDIRLLMSWFPWPKIRLNDDLEGGCLP